jgi:hypothetical protein
LLIGASREAAAKGVIGATLKIGPHHKPHQDLTTAEFLQTPATTSALVTAISTNFDAPPAKKVLALRLSNPPAAARPPGRGWPPAPRRGPDQKNRCGSVLVESVVVPGAVMEARTIDDIVLAMTGAESCHARR